QAVALDHEHHRLAGVALDALDELLPVIQGLAVEAQQAIATLKPGCLRRPLGIEAAQHRRHRWPPRLDAQAGQRVRLGRAAQPLMQYHATRALQAAARLAHQQIEGAALAESSYQLQVDRAPAGGRLAIHRDYLLP